MGKQRVDLNNKTILVTGSPGFIGAYLVIQLLHGLTAGTVISKGLKNINNDIGLNSVDFSFVEYPVDRETYDRNVTNGWQSLLRSK